MLFIWKVNTVQDLVCLGFYTCKEREAEVIWCSNGFQTLMNCNVYVFIWTDLKLLLDCDGVSHTLMGLWELGFGWREKFADWVDW
jgi:hypothetical protein